MPVFAEQMFSYYENEDSINMTITNLTCIIHFHFANAGWHNPPRRRITVNAQAPVKFMVHVLAASCLYLPKNLWDLFTVYGTNLSLE